MKKIATNESDIAEVIKNLSVDEKLERVKRFYEVEEVLEILGYYDDSMDKDDKAKLEGVNFDSPQMEKILYSMAINNGNFEEAIAYNARLPI